MSTDFDAVCVSCRERVHLGTRFANKTFTFGNAPSDRDGREKVEDFIHKHQDHDLRILPQQMEIEDIE